MAKEKSVFSLLEMPNYEYPLGIACPTCYRPLTSRKKGDATCDVCLEDKKIFPVNYRRKPKPKSSEEDEYPYSEEDE